MSRPAFARQFTAVVGLTPLAYLSRVRLDLAARLLGETDDQVGDIAQAVGYSSEFAFSREQASRPAATGVRSRLADDVPITGMCGGRKSMGKAPTPDDGRRGREKSSTEEDLPCRFR